ncbi:MAG TPA: NUDIX hydrolase [Cyanobacteria bacterium UBA9971]|nr:NUDIX hydrolase [Cyanobacteria bacterium UBA9971]
MAKEYKNPALTTDIILFSCDGEKDLKVLLIKRKYEPFKDKWAFPGGFVEYDEELETAAHRELEEETGIKDLCLKQLGTFGRVGRDPRGRTVSVVYYAFVDDASKLNVKAQDDAKDARWFNIKKLPELAFDHAEILDCALANVKQI